MTSAAMCRFAPYNPVYKSFGCNDGVMARYRIDPDRSRIWINASSSLHPIHSETNGLEGWVDLTIDDSGRVDVTAPAAAHLELPVSRLRSSNRIEDRELKRRIDARRYPTISGDLTSITPGPVGDRPYTIEGDVTFRGVTRPHRDGMGITAEDNTLRLEGESTFDIRDFGMEPPRILMLRVHPEVNVRVAILAVRDEGPGS